MRILVIKMSSMGDVFHTFPALSDAKAALPDLEVDWVVEKSFAEIPKWHPAVKQVFAIELRKWRKNPFAKDTRKAIHEFFAEVNANHYDLVLDAQGLLKSIWVARKIKAPVYGMDWQSVREPLASLFYQNKFKVDKDQHAIWRLRELFAKVLDYEVSINQPITYGLDTSQWQKPEPLLEQFGDDEYLVFLHGTTWDTKYWPEENWVELLAYLTANQLKVMLPWGNEEEKLRAHRIAKNATADMVWVPEQALNLNAVAQILNFAKAVISVDTGLSHVAAALDVPMTVLYRVTDPKLIGAGGDSVTRLISPLASMYIKKFNSPKQEVESMEGLSVEAVKQSLKLDKCNA